MKVRNAWFVVGALILSGGCKKGGNTEMAPMGEAAPAYASSSTLSTMPGFIVGRWCMVEGGTPNAKRYYEFKADGAFESGNTGNEWKSTGKWTEQNGSILLQYETMNGKSMMAFQEQYKKDEEGGGQVSIQRALFYDNLYRELGQLTQLTVDEDKKHLFFGTSKPKIDPQAMGMGGESGEMAQGLQNMLSAMQPTLERMGPKKKA